MEDSSTPTSYKELTPAYDEGSNEPSGGRPSVDSDSSIHFGSEAAKRAFNSLVDYFIEDYMIKKYVAEKSGWRTLSEIANKSGISASALYGKNSTLSPVLGETVRRGLVEIRIFPGERGRGGEVTRVRIAYDKEPIREYVNERIRHGKKGTITGRVSFLGNKPSTLESVLQTSENQRRLSAIMFTDFVGFTALTQNNEAKALKLLSKHNELIRPVISKHAGREIKTIGDSFLAEFESALGATNCAVEIQQVLHEHNLDSKDQIPVRVGIHVGDVVHQKGDIFGDAVNIASRIESIAGSGEICVSEQVYDQIRNKVPFKLSKLTPEDLRNFSLPIGVYRMELSWERGLQDATLERNRIAILPFANISADSNDAYFADGMTEELISTMAKINSLQVIARTSVIRYKTATKSVEEIGKELKAGTILEGSVRKEGEKLRITAQLIDSMDGSHMWTEVYDRNLKDTFAIQSEIAEKVASALKLKLLPSEKIGIESVPTKNTKAHTLCLKGIYCIVNASSENDLVKAKRYFESAIELDRDYASAYSWLGDTYTTLCQAGFLSSMEAIPKAERAVMHSLELEPNLDNSHRVLGFIMTMRDNPDWTRAELETLKALEINPNSSVTHESYAWILSLMGRLDEAQIEAEKALELDPFSHSTNQTLALVFYFKRKYDDAIHQLQKTREFELENLGLSIWLGMCYVHKSMFDEAIEVFKQMSQPEKGKSNLLLSYLAFAYARSGRVVEARKILSDFNETSRHQFIPALATAQIHAALGEVDETIENLERALNEGDYASLQDLKVSPVWDSIRRDPRFQVLLKKRKLEQN